MNGSCEKLGGAPLRSVHELRVLILSGGPVGQVAPLDHTAGKRWGIKDACCEVSC